MTVIVDRDRLAKVLALISSPVDGEALAAVRTAVKMLAAAGMRPEQLVDGVPHRRIATAWTVTPSSSPDINGHRPKPPRSASFRDLGPTEARDIIADLLSAGILPKHVQFLRTISERLYARPHEGLRSGEWTRSGARCGRHAPTATPVRGSSMTARSETRQRLVEMRERLVVDLGERIDGGTMSLLLAINAAISAIDAEPLPEAESAGRAVVSDDGETIRVVLYAGANAVGAVVLDPMRAVRLAGGLIEAAGRRLR
jgi:hypothetical protein